MMYNVSFLTDVGLVREHNEDTVLVDTRLHLFLVADGMGGHEKGEIASQILVDSFQNAYSPQNTSEMNDDTIVPLVGVEDRLNNCIKVATDKIFAYAQEKEIDGTIGTTVVGLKYITYSRTWVIFHLGDSRAYLYRQGSLTQVTTDHSKYEEMKKNNMSEEEIEKTGKNVITKAIGNFNAFELEIDYHAPKIKDIFLLCSDGVSDLCSNEELLRLIIQYKNNLELLCIQIKNLVYTRGAKDNLSVIAIEIR
ncbi:MAG: protein phosphatase 2C domain-containing protein [Sulfurovum sp.]|nr:protein phosphatase 2C domain-containing protein [Sulfurovum sp.]